MLPVTFIPALLLIPILIYASLQDLLHMRVPVRVYVPWFIMGLPLIIGIIIFYSLYQEAIAVVIVVLATLFTATRGWVGLGDVVAVCAAAPSALLFSSLWVFGLAIAAPAVVVMFPLLLLSVITRKEPRRVPLVPFITAGVVGSFIWFLI